MLKELKIGNVIAPNNLVLAPMAGVTDMAFRIICKKFEAGLIYTEMASSKAMHYKDKKTHKVLDFYESERPVTIQMFGSNPEILVETAKLLCDDVKPDIIDINMGCPAPKIVNNGDGSALLKDLPLIDKITKEVVKASSVPVTIKIRKGWDDSAIVACEVAKIAEANGISAIAVHGRTRQQFYSGLADLDIIQKVKENVKIPVIGNGDIIDYTSAKNMFDRTNCDGIMIGRGVMGTPWIFKEIIYGFNGVEKFHLTNEEKLKIILEHYHLALQFKGEKRGILEMRKHIGWYLKGFPNATYIRESLNKMIDKNQIEECLIQYFGKL